MNISIINSTLTLPQLIQRTISTDVTPMPRDLCNIMASYYGIEDILQKTDGDIEQLAADEKEIVQLVGRTQTHLSFTFESVTVEKITQLVSVFPLLTHVQFNFSWATYDTILSVFTTIPKLESLSLTPCIFFTNASFVHIAALRKLQALELHQCWNITDEGLSHLSQLHKLHRLALQGSFVTNRGISALQQKVPSLQQVALKSWII